jgi:hypothetical protein
MGEIELHKKCWLGNLRERNTHKCDDNTKIDFRKRVLKVLIWIHLAMYRRMSGTL